MTKAGLLDALESSSACRLEICVTGLFVIFVEGPQEGGNEIDIAFLKPDIREFGGRIAQLARTREGGVLDVEADDILQRILPASMQIRLRMRQAAQSGCFEERNGSRQERFGRLRLASAGK